MDEIIFQILKTKEKIEQASDVDKVILVHRELTPLYTALGEQFMREMLNQKETV